MTRQQQIELLHARIAQAQDDCEAWRRSGPEERFNQAYIVAKELQLQLDELLCQPDR